MMNRINVKAFLFPGIQAFMIAVLFSACSSQPEPRPNILFCIADDWGWFHAGVYDDPVVKTPAFDRLANEGVLFNYAYVSSPSCTPCRNSILTGQWHWRLGHGANLHSQLDPSLPVYPLLLEDAGYFTGRWRKSYGPGRLEGWERHPAGTQFEGGFGEFLEARPGGQPFCFWFGASDPHRPYDTGSGIASGIPADQIRLFECFPDAQEVRSDVADYYFEVQRWDSDVAAAIALLEEIGELDHTLIVMTGDHGMPFPRCKSNLYDSGTRVPLAIRWGSAIRHPGRVLDDFVSLTDLAPTFLEAAGVEIPAGMTGRSLIPLLEGSGEGFTDPENRNYILFGKERHVPAQEENLGGYPCRGIRTHDYLYIRNFEPDRWPAGTPDYENAAIPGAWLADCDNGGTKTYIVENKNKDEQHQWYWNLSFGKRPAEELYDCRKDPEQLNNVAGDPAYAEIKAELSARLMEQLEDTSDPRVIGGGEKFDEYPYYGGAPKHPSFNQ